jgi:hypothetical protein
MFSMFHGAFPLSFMTCQHFSRKVSIGIASLLDLQYGCRRCLLAIALTVEHADLVD